MKKYKITLLVSVIVSIVLEALPYGAVCNFATPEKTIRQTFSYFSLTPFGYANFGPFITACLTARVHTPVGNAAAVTVDGNSCIVEFFAKCIELCISKGGKIFSVNISGFDIFPSQFFCSFDLNIQRAACLIGKTG